MTKLELKLIELGYEFIYCDYDKHSYRKNVNGCRVIIDIYKGRLLGRYIEKTIFHQQDIDNLQQAFNQLQSDLKELKEYE